MRENTRNIIKQTEFYHAIVKCKCIKPVELSFDKDVDTTLMVLICCFGIGWNTFLFSYCC